MYLRSMRLRASRITIYAHLGIDHYKCCLLYVTDSSTLFILLNAMFLVLKSIYSFICSLWSSAHSTQDDRIEQIDFIYLPSNPPTMRLYMLHRVCLVFPYDNKMHEEGQYLI